MTSDVTSEAVAPPPAEALAELVGLLDLEKIEEDIYRGVSPRVSLQRVFGGQVAGQALVAAGRTVDADHEVHSLHAYFIRGGDPTVPIIYTVDRVRDGRSFSVRRVVAIQHGLAIFTLSASFQLPQPGFEHSAAMPDVPAPETLPGMAERLVSPELDPQAGLPRPFDIRYVTLPAWEQRPHGGTLDPHRLWLRTAAPLPDDPLVHVCALTFATDLTLLDTVLRREGLASRVDPVKAASLDHAMWFHRPFRADEWLLYESESVSAAGSRGLASGKIFTADGRHVVTVMQEGMLRI